MNYTICFNVHLTAIIMNVWVLSQTRILLVEDYYSGLTSIMIMDPKLESLDNNCSADEIAEYIDRLNFSIDT